MDEGRQQSDASTESLREVQYRHSRSFVDVLRECRATLLVSTYQEGKLVAIATRHDQLHFSFHQFDQAMGVAVRREHFAVGAKGQIWFLQNNSQIAPSLQPPVDSMPVICHARHAQGDLVLIEGRVANWTKILRDRFARTMPDVLSQVQFIRPLPNDDFLQLVAMADVMLDTIHFGGGNTSYEALALGTPVVTQPSQLLRSRITCGLYHKMEFHDLVVTSRQQYVDCVVRCANDSKYRAKIRPNHPGPRERTISRRTGGSRS